MAQHWFSSFRKAGSTGITNLVFVTTNPLLPGAAAGSPYSFQFAVAGAVGAVTFSLISQTGGNAFTLSSSGALTGTPTAGPLSTLTVQAQDQSGRPPIQAVFSVSVIQITTGTTLPSATQGVAYSTALTVIGDPRPGAWAITADSPDTGSWLSINANTGQLYGTPTTAETESVTVAYTSSTGVVCTQTFSLAVEGMAATPVFSPAAGTYASTQTVSIACATPTASIFYTLDGTTPTISSTPYMAPISVSVSETIKAIATAPGYLQSAVGSATYSIGLTATPTFSPAAGNYTGTQLVSIACATSGATIYYTIGGTTPTTSSPVYTGPITVTATETINAIALASGYVQSNVASATFTISAPAQVSTSGYKFAAGHMFMSSGYEFGTSQSVWQNEISNILAPTKAGFIGYETCITWAQVEDFTQTKNLNTNTVAGINTQYPGILSRLEACYYYLQAVLPGFYFGICHNDVHYSPANFTNEVITGNWNTNGYTSVPYWVRNCTGISGTSTPGTLTVPDYFGASTTGLYSGAINPIYSGSSYYGFGFANLSNSTSFSILWPAVWMPSVNQARNQMHQACAAYVLSSGVAYSASSTYTLGQAVSYNGTSYLTIGSPPAGTLPTNTAYFRVNTDAGKTFDQCPYILYRTTNDEYSISMNVNLSGGQVVNPPAGFTPASMHAGTFQNAQVNAAAFPHTMHFTCQSYGAYGNTSDTASQMAAYQNNGLPQQSGQFGYNTIAGLGYSNADTYAADWVSNGGYSANPAKQGVLGIQNPQQVNAPVPTSLSLRGQIAIAAQVQNEDLYSSITSGCAGGNNAQTVRALLYSGLYLGAQIFRWNPFDQNYNYSAWSYISGAINGPATAVSQSGSNMTITNANANSSYPTAAGQNLLNFRVLITSGAQAGQSALISSNTASSFTFPAISGLTGTPSFVLYWNVLPTGLMYGVPVVAQWTSTTTATVTWSPPSNVGDLMTYTLSRSINGGSTSVIATGLTSGTYNDTGLAASDVVVYSIQMVNPNGTGPAGPTFTLNMPVFDFPTFAGPPSTIDRWNSCAFNDPTHIYLLYDSGHATGGYNYSSLIGTGPFTTHFQFQFNHPQVSMGFGFGMWDTQNVATGSDANMNGYSGPVTNRPVCSFFVAMTCNDAETTSVPSGQNFAGVNLFYNGGVACPSLSIPGTSNQLCLKPLNSVVPYGIYFNNEDVFDATITYDGSYLTLVIEDTNTGAQSRNVWPFNLAGTTNGNGLYVGFMAGAPASPDNILMNSWDFAYGTPPVLATPTFSPAAGSYSGTQSVSISGPSGATIYYTTNGLLPTSASTLYTGPITVSTSEVINAVAIQTGYTDSYVGQAAYQINTSNPINFPTGFVAGNLVAVGTSILSGSVLELTNGGTVQCGSAWFPAPVSITSFSTTFHITTAGQGMCFVLQNNQPPWQPLTGVQITGTGGQISFNALTQAGPGQTNPLYVGDGANYPGYNGNNLEGQFISISGSVPTSGPGSIVGYTPGTKYFVSATNGTSTATLQTATGGAVTTVPGTPGGTFSLNMYGWGGGPTTIAIGNSSLGYGGVNGLNDLEANGPGYAFGITPSVCVAFNQYGSTDTYTDPANSVGFYTNGNTPGGSGIATGLTFANGMTVTLTYSGTTLSININNGAFTHSWTGINIAQIVGGNTAYAGFVAGTGGGSHSVQSVSNWTMN